jgi:hypothetical protein
VPPQKQEKKKEKILVYIHRYQILDSNPIEKMVENG